jgi:hypothetical protein
MRNFLLRNIQTRSGAEFFGNASRYGAEATLIN